MAAAIGDGQGEFSRMAEGEKKWRQEMVVAKEGADGGVVMMAVAAEDGDGGQQW
jgi:hypothetical protein